uniref:conjugal transfer protein TraG N-terminal domain-containing protein n=1 Tax=Azovibrio restrictus TaxID=146938 RepID=UPI0026E9A3B6
MNYEVYSYWNLLELQGVFNAVAALTASGDFTGLLRVLALVVMITLVLAVLAGRSRHEDFWRWVIMAAIVNGMLLVPKSTVILVDRTGTEPNRVVANVPIGLAALAHGASKFGDWITRAYETVFSLPNDLQFQRRGLMFGHAVLTETQFLSPDMVSGAWMKDFQEFWRECVTPDIVTGYLPIDTLRKTTDLWSAIGNTNPARYVTLSTVGTVSCHPAAYNDLGNRLNNSVVPALITSYGLKKFPNDPQAVTNAQNGIVAAYGYGPGISNTAQSIVRQAALQQAMVQAYCGVFAQSGDSNRAALCYSTAMGAYQTNQTYQVLAKIAESSMPKLKSAIEIIQYAIAPIIIAFAIVAAHLSLPVLKTYAMSLVWVQLWAPLYAVVHYIQTVKMQAYQAALGASAGTLEGSAQLVNMGVSDQAVAGMLVVAIPPIAAALVKGGEVGLQAVAGLVSAPRTAERQAADTAKGNESVGQWKTSPTVDYAASPTPVMARRNDDGSYTYAHPDGGVTYNAGTAADKATFSVKSTGREARSASRLSEAAETAAAGELVSGARTLGASIQRGIDFARSHLKETGNDNRWGIDNAAEIAKAAETAQNIQDKYLKEHEVNEKLHAAITGTAQLVAGTPELLN